MRQIREQHQEDCNDQGSAHRGLLWLRQQVCLMHVLWLHWLQLLRHAWLHGMQWHPRLALILQEIWL